mmetsp:Transcript_29726/g.60367  ORF Transcript_29726/g.60367 Transcript_29726/m.60367 type:complete len:80 (-) Transcript_29726:981-1220(-)
MRPTHARAKVLKNICRTQNKTEAMPSGNERSTTSNSLPNRVRSCPLGVAEKNDSGALKTEESIPRCRYFDARTPTRIIR